jgi:large subunit ribosomal protein L13
MKTTLLNKKDVKRKYYLVDAEGKILGRLAVQLAMLLSGKRKSDHTPNVDNGDFVVVVNAGKIAVTGKKLEDKVYTYYSGYPSGLTIKNLETLMRTKPTEAVHHAVKGMLPKNKLGSRMITRLKIYAGSEHSHQAQNPEKVEPK